MREAVRLISEGAVHPEILVTHIGGLTAAKDTTLNLPSIPGGKKLLYTHHDLPLVAIADFAEEGKTNPLYAALAEICDRNNGLWSLEAEEYFTANAPKL